MDIPTSGKDKLSLHVRGQVMCKNSFPSREPNGRERYSLDVAVPGCKEMLSVSVDGPTFGSVKELDIFESDLSFQVFKGRLYFNPYPKK